MARSRCSGAFHPSSLRPHPSSKSAWSGSVSRILFPARGEDHSSVTRVAAVIEQPTRKLLAETGGSIASLFGLAPQGVCRAVATHVGRGALLPHRFTLTAGRLRDRVGGLFSVALSVASRRLVVNQPAARLEFGLSSKPCGPAILRSAPRKAAQQGECRNRSRAAFTEMIRVKWLLFRDLETMSARRHR